MRLMVLLSVLAFAGVPDARASGPAVTVLLGKGVQVYSCTKAEAGYAWSLKAPDATLTDTAGRKIGHHFAGPSWQAEDGSTVVGEALATNQPPRPGAIPWLVLRAKAHAGNGLFANVAYIVRSDTEGGVAPATGCDATHAGAETRVDYSATYTFFRG